MKRKIYTDEQIIGILNELEAANTKLKKLLADTMLEKTALEDVFRRK